MKNKISAIDVETYAVPWWGTERSKLDRPIFRVLHLRNKWVQLHHVVVQGRPLGNYILPYWPVRSSVSILSPPAEIAHQGFADFVLGEEHREEYLRIGNPRDSHHISRPGRGFELAPHPNGAVLRVTNEGSTCPLLMEHSFLIKNSDPWLEISVRATNISSQDMRSLTVGVTYQQAFDWSLFGTGGRDKYVVREPPSTGRTSRFFAYSEGDERGYEFVAGEGARLAYRLSHEMNSWTVRIFGRARRLARGASLGFHYFLRAPTNPPSWVLRGSLVSVLQPDLLPFSKITPVNFRLAPKQTRRRVMLPQMIDNLSRPKTRGLSMASAPHRESLKGLDLLKDWGCNLVITGLGDREETKNFISKAHALEMEAFLQGKGSYEDGEPSFEELESEGLEPNERPDSYGQDEDHYYWHGIKPSRNFKEDLAKEFFHASKIEMVSYWSRCFSDKWRAILKKVRRLKAGSGIWFYTPTPSIANVDPSDYYDIFMRETARIGEALTIFPFYYGTEYRQIEYMIRRWKSAGASRVVFLTMRDFLDRPSQFIRALTAARRGGSDGACGFHFNAGRNDPWQWKSVMLGAWANFPTPELDAFCFMEEPAELVESLATRPVLVRSSGVEVKAFVEKLNALLPGGAEEIIGDYQGSEKLLITIRIGPSPAGGRALPKKGIVKMERGTLEVSGLDQTGVSNAMRLLLRFAELAMYE